MKNHIVFKFLAIALCALVLLTAVGSGIGIVALALVGIDDSRSVEQSYQYELQGILQWIGYSIAGAYESRTYGGLPDDMLNQMYYTDAPLRQFRTGTFFYELVDQEGTVVTSSYEAVEGLRESEIRLQGVSYSKVAAGPIRAHSEYQARIALAEYISGEKVPADYAGMPEESWEAAEEDAVFSESTATEDAGPADPDTAVMETTPTEAASESSNGSKTAGLSEAPAVAAEEPVQAAPNSVIQIPQGSTVTIVVAPGAEVEYVPTADEWADSILTEALGPYSVQSLHENYGYANYYFTTQEIGSDYTFRVYMTSNSWKDENQWELLRIAERHKTQLLGVLGVSLLLFAVFAAYLCTAAGRKPGSSEVHPSGLNCLPLDLYGCIVAGGIALILFLIAESFEYFLRSELMTAISVAVYGGYGACLLFVGFCYAAAAQFKTPGAYWWNHSVCGWCWKLAAMAWGRFWKICRRLLKGLPEGARQLINWTRDLCKALWTVGMALCLWLLKKARSIWRLAGTLIRMIFGKVAGAVIRFYSLLPLTWQWLLTGFAIILILVLTINSYSALRFVMGIGLCVAMVLYGASAFGILLESTRRMREGDLEVKVDDRILVGSFKEFSEELNGLADVAVVAAQKQLKSERMKTELITNVSHDIKTPLTSIINYVDLLQKPHTDEEEKVYLEVLARQSQRMKKLIDDLMEMSKASTGNLPVEITRVDAAEAVNQALGEFDDKLNAAQLTVVYRQPEEPVLIMADGRLVWRALSNLLSNAVKYALPGTRLYVDIGETNGKIFISVKNISREPLNVSADELLERFVRGDASRNTDGSGLGLNIAKSLMELQHGELELLVDGDLFKVTLLFQKA